MAQYVLAASVLLTLTGGALYYLSSAGSPDHAAIPPHVQEFMDQFSELRNLEQDLDARKLQFVSLVETRPSAAVHGYFVYNDAARQGHFFAFDLPPLSRGELYYAWLLNHENRVLTSQLLELNDRQVGGCLMQVPSDAGPPTSVLVTRERVVDPTSPSEDIEIKAAILSAGAYNEKR